jgi:hypothetical protein
MTSASKKSKETPPQSIITKMVEEIESLPPPWPPDMVIKTCTRCHKELPLTYFSPDSKGKHKTYSICKECKRKKLS